MKQAFDKAMVELQKDLARAEETAIAKAKRVQELELVLNELHACILAGGVTGAITDTLWVGPGRTAVDAIEHALGIEREN